LAPRLSTGLRAGNTSYYHVRAGHICFGDIPGRNERGCIYGCHTGSCVDHGGLVTTYIALTTVGEYFGVGKNAIAGFKVLLREALNILK